MNQKNYDQIIKQLTFLFDNYYLSKEYKKVQNDFPEQFQAILNMRKYLSEINKIQCSNWPAIDFLIIDGLRNVNDILVPFIVATLSSLFIVNLFKDIFYLGIFTQIIPLLIIVALFFIFPYFLKEKFKEFKVIFFQMVIFLPVAIEIVNMLEIAFMKADTVVMYSILPIYILFFIALTSLCFKVTKDYWYKIRLESIYKVYNAYNNRIDLVNGKVEEIKLFTN
ncbi:MAG: hypothetical protein AB1782_16765 [Cyanobacteriota bacterium]